tara:strand:- start:1188 stop:2117 length:930 start_codon:yes stop_codon:yes gene_type:complete
MNIGDMFEKQEYFNNLFFDKKSLSDSEKEEITKSLVLALHTEASELISAINFKDHRQVKSAIDREKILYESIDVFRYLVSILNLWDIDPVDFVGAFDDKDLFLHMRHRMESEVWKGQPVLIFDLDDVIAEFRHGFTSWLESEKSVKVNHASTEYYTTSEVISAGLNPEAVFDEFISCRGLQSLQPVHNMIETVNKLEKDGYWIHILTARPDDVLLCRYDTFRWLSKSGLNFHRLSFSAEKYRWLTRTKYFDENKIVCAIDDSAKHCAEYAKHSIKTLAPVKIYNQEIEDLENVYMYSTPDDLYHKIKSI